LSRGSTGFKTLGTHFTFEEDGTQSLVGLKRTAAQITQVRAEALYRMLNLRYLDMKSQM
jgi:hypothetical protein